MMNVYVTKTNFFVVRATLLIKIVYLERHVSSEYHEVPHTKA